MAVMWVQQKPVALPILFCILLGCFFVSRVNFVVSEEHFVVPRVNFTEEGSGNTTGKPKSPAQQKAPAAAPAPAPHFVVSRVDFTEEHCDPKPVRREGSAICIVTRCDHRYTYPFRTFLSSIIAQNQQLRPIHVTVLATDRSELDQNETFALANSAVEMLNPSARGVTVQISARRYHDDAVKQYRDDCMDAKPQLAHCVKGDDACRDDIGYGITDVVLNDVLRLKTKAANTMEEEHLCSHVLVTQGDNVFSQHWMKVLDPIMKQHTDDLIGYSWVSHYSHQAYDKAVMGWHVGGIDLGAAIMKADTLRRHPTLRFCTCPDEGYDEGGLMYERDGQMFQAISKLPCSKTTLLPHVLYFHE